MSDAQDYEYKELTEEKMKVYYKRGSWRVKYRSVIFTDEAREKFGEFGPKLHEAYKAANGEYDGAFVSSVIPGITREKFSWPKVNIIFGVKREYYDFSF